MKEASSDIDESLYSRQLYVMGHEAQRKMAASSVLIVGLNGLGVEVAKNVILAGVKSVALHDTNVVTYADLSAQFYFSEADLGANRAAVSAPKLAELNPHVAVSVVHDLDLASLKDHFKIVVLIDVPAARRAEIADHCHANGVYVVAGDTYGVFGSIFCDFGPSFVVHDIDGEAAFSSMIASITRDTKALVTTLEETRHNLVSGDFVTLTEIAGMTELNGQQFMVEVRDPYSFIIDVDTTNFTPYERSGYVNQVKMPSTISFKSYSHALREPGEFVCDFSKIHRAAQLHMAFRGLEAFQQAHGVLPEPGNPQHAEEVFRQTVAYNASLPSDGASLKLSEKDLQDEEKLIRRLAMCSRGQVSPICALLGGILGQEVLKGCSGKFNPIRQWFYYDAVEALHDEPLPAVEVAPLNCRYDGQIMVFGRTMQVSFLSRENASAPLLSEKNCHKRGLIFTHSCTF
jgi:ubiquitin-activating enzyme E1